MFHIYFELAVSLSFNFIGFPKFKHARYCHAKKKSWQCNILLFMSAMTETKIRN